MLATSAQAPCTIQEKTDADAPAHPRGFRVHPGRLGKEG